ncbi:MAG: hypothetical protein AB7D06_00040 [Pedobacter sp.]
MEIIQIVLLEILIIFLFWVRFYLLSRPAKYTACPKCGKRNKKIPAGTYSCSNCNAKFLVNEHGVPELPTINSIILGFVLALAYSAFCVFGIVRAKNHFGHADGLLVSGLVFGVFSMGFALNALIKHRNKFGE